MDLKEHIRSIVDWPKKGIVFRDITPLLQGPKTLQTAVDMLVEDFVEFKPDMVVAPEARGFIFGTAVAIRLGAGFAPIRKPGKLPAETIEETYELEYGTDTLTMHKDALSEGQRVLVLDDLLATGGTAKACCKMVERLGGVVAGCGFLVELSFLPGRRTLEGYDVVSLVDYDAE
jgi:adenine phosphoribosyltransferase